MYLLFQVHDRAQVFVSCPSKNKRPKYAGTIERWSNQAISLPNLECISPIKLLILVHDALLIHHQNNSYRVQKLNLAQLDLIQVLKNFRNNNGFKESFIALPFPMNFLTDDLTLTIILLQVMLWLLISFLKICVFTWDI